MTAAAVAPDHVRLALHMPRLLRLATRMTGSRESAEDLVQDTLERFLRARRTPLGDEFRYLARSLRNNHISRLRAERSRVRTVALDDTLEAVLAAPARDAAVHDARAALAAVARLPAHYRDALVAVDVTGLSYEQAARALGVPVGTVMSRLYRGRRSVVEALG